MLLRRWSIALAAPAASRVHQHVTTGSTVGVRMRKVLFAGAFLRLLDDDGWEFVDRPASVGVVCVVAVDNNHILLVEQFRPSQQANVISLPGGIIDRAAPGETQESAINAAVRELREETGYLAGSAEIVGSGPVAPGITTELINIVLARDLVRTDTQALDSNEKISVHRVCLDELQDWLFERVQNGARIDLKVFVGLYFLQLVPRRPDNATS
jgi:ADP-ribose pyrophosphatase